MWHDLPYRMSWIFAAWALWASLNGSLEESDRRALAGLPREARVQIRAAARRYELTPAHQAELGRICRRESWCREMGPHAVDAHLGARQWRRAVRVGRLTPSSCPHHELERGGWGTRGPMGLVAAYHLEGCRPASVLDTFAGGIDAAARKVHGLRDAPCWARARLWAGPRAWDRRTVRRRYANVRRQCGVIRARMWLVTAWR